MNSQNLQALGSVNPPPSRHGDTTFAVNQFGDIALLDADGRIKISTMRGDADHVIHDMPVDHFDLLTSCKFTNIEFNEDGTILLLWSEKCAGVLEIPRALAPDGAIDVSASNCSALFSMIGEDYLCSASVFKASFHPMSSSHVVLLTKGSLLLIDVSSPNGDTQFYPLGVKDNFISYCFGPSIDWMKFSIFLISDKKSEKAEIFCLCPVIPKDILVPKNSVRDLWAWMDEQIVFQEQNSSGDQYLDRVRQYLTAAFGPRKSIEKEEKKGNNAARTSSYIRVGQYALSSGSQYIEMEGLLSDAPSLQGPFYILDNCSASGSESGSSLMSVSEQNNSTLQKPKRSPCDICTPKIRGDGAPVLIVSYYNGDVDYHVIGGEENDQCSDDITPLWLSTENNTESSRKNSAISTYGKYEHEKNKRKSLPPGLVLVERIPVRNAIISGRSSSGSSTSTSSCRWTLLPDPVVTHCVHATNRSTGESYLLSCFWLLKTLSQNMPDGAGVGNGDDRGRGGIASTSAGFAVGYDHFDCFLRHTALFRSLSGTFSAVDLTLHMKLCAQHIHTTELEILPSSAESRALNPSLEGISWNKVTQGLLTQAMEGLQSIPQPSAESSGASQSATQCTKALHLASEHMEGRVAPPLQELSRRIRYRVDVLKDTYAAQLELLEGSAESSDPADVCGLKARLSDLSVSHEVLQKRMSAIEDRATSQRQRMSDVYNAAMMMRTKLSQAERDHREQLVEWCSLLKHMDIGVDALRRQVREQAKRESTQHQGALQSRVVNGSARKAFPPPLGPHPPTPGDDFRTSSAPMTPTSERKSQSSGASMAGYRSPGFGSGPSYAYGMSKEQGGASSQSASVSASASKPRRSAYMAQASPAGKTLSFGSVNSNNSLPFSSAGKGAFGGGFGSPVGFGSPAPARNFVPQSPAETPDRAGYTANSGDLTDAEVAACEVKINAQQSVLDMAEASLRALEERVRCMREQRALS